MPTPMQPMRPMTPGMAKKVATTQALGGIGAAANASKQLAKATGASASSATNSLIGKLTGAGTDDQDPSTKQPGEKAFSIKTAQDPDGTIHVYAKDQNEAKKKYQDLGNPLGNATMADEVQEDLEGGFDWATIKNKALQTARSKGATRLGWDHNLLGDQKDKTFDPDEEEKKPYSNYNQSWSRKQGKTKEKDNAVATKSEPTFKAYSKGKPFHMVTSKDHSGSTVIMAKDANEARLKWERKYGSLGDKLLAVKAPHELEENMNTTLKTTFEGIEDTVAGLLESFGLENGRDFYIEGTIKTLDEQVAQDILSVLADHELPGQAHLRNLGEQWSISLIGQGEELVENLSIGEDAIEVRHIGEGVVRVYVNNELAEQFETGTAAFKYVKALQENLAEAEQELMSAITAEAGEDLMKVSNITEGWEDMLKAVKDRDDKKVGDKWKTSKGEVEKTATGVKHTRSYDAKTGETDDEKPKDADGNPVKRGRGRPKKVRESIAALRQMRKQVSEALAKIDALPEAQRNTPQVQAMVDRLTESVRSAIAKAK